MGERNDTPTMVSKIRLKKVSLRAGIALSKTTQ